MTSVEDRYRQARADVLEQPDATDGPPVAGLAPGPWVDVLAEADLRAEVGVPALVDGRAVAVFRTHTGEIFALSNYDPVTGASVMARGIVGTRGDVPVVASPMYKDVFDLRTGRCMDDEAKRLTPYEIRVTRGVVQVREPHEGAGGAGYR